MRFSDGTGAAWTAHDDDDTLSQYGCTLVNFLSFLVQTADNEELGYKLPMTEAQKELVKKLKEALENEICDISAIHELFYSYTAPPTNEDAMAKWSDALQCFLAVANLRPDGTFTSPGNFTQQLSHWEYLMRGSGLYEMVENSSRMGYSSILE